MKTPTKRLQNKIIDLIKKGKLYKGGQMFCTGREATVYTDVAITLMTRTNSSDNFWISIDQDMKIKSNTIDGYQEITEDPAIIDISYPTSTTRRGRVQGGGKLSPTITCAGTDGLVVLYQKPFKIRKLTERESFRLMGVRDGDIDQIQSSGISKNQQYKMAGNSIVCNVLEAIFLRMFVNTEPQKGEQLTIF